jgi:hypothetical protein
MKRVLSLLLLVPFLSVQAWALSGGPFDSIYGRSMAALSGTYGVVLSGNVLAEDSKDPNKLASVNPETTGVMTMVIPTSGMATGRVLMFAQGLMYLGNAQGTVDQRSGKITLMSQVSHYVARTVSDGITKQSGFTIDSVLSGKMNLSLSLDFFSGLIEVGGDAAYYRFDPMMTQVIRETTTANTAQNAAQNQTAVESANATQASTTNTNENKSVNQSTNSATNSTTVNADGSTTTNADTTGTTSNSLTASATGSNATSSDTRTSDLTKGSTVNAGTVTTKETFRPDLVRETPKAFTFMSLTASGVRQDVAVNIPPPFAPPAEATSFQIDLPAPTSGGAGGTGGAGGAAAAQAGN